MRLRQRHIAIVWIMAAVLAVAWSQGALASVEEDYQQAKEQYQEFREDDKAMQRRDKWIAQANRFLGIAKKHPQHRRAAGCYYWAGFVYRDMYEVSYLEKDRDKAITTWRKLIELYPTSTLCDDVWVEIAKIYESRGDLAKAYDELSKMLDSYPQGDMARQARLDVARLRPRVPHAQPTPAPAPVPTPVSTPKPATPATKPVPQVTPAMTPPPAQAGEISVVGIRYWSYPTYTRVVVDLNERVEYKANFLEADPATGAPRRLYVDFYGAQLHPTLTEPMQVGDGLLRAVRFGQPKDEVARIVLDFDKIIDYRMFSLDSPFRLVIDVSGSSYDTRPGDFTIRRIVLDAGHGGRDPGAVGRHRGRVSYEKTYTLDLVNRIKPILERELGAEVILTRSNDVYVPLEKRTAIANQHNADLFVSIHINASRRKAPTGFETFYLAPKADPSDEELIALLALENNTDIQTAREINLVLGDLAYSDKLNESSYLAEAVQKSMVNGLRTKYKNILDRGVKRAPFYVLVGAHMPCILVEAGFITNSKEAGRLSQPNFRQNLATAIARGIIEYANQIQN